MIRTSLFVCVVAAATTAIACAPPALSDREEKASTSSSISKRYNSDHPPGKQNDDWSCSVYTTSWMLQATANDESWSSVSSYMKKTGRVTEAQGLSDASGAGLAQTLRDMATGNPSVGSDGDVTFDEVKEKAGKMAVGIGGRAWNHWSGVAGYDAANDVLILANSALTWKGVGGYMDRTEFRNLGAMSMVWMDYGDEPPPPPFEPSARPTDGSFPALHIKSPSVPVDGFVTQCNESADGERVWKTTSTGPDENSRWAQPLYPQRPYSSCGAANDGVYPLVFRNLHADAFGAYIVACSGYGDKAQRVFHTEGEVEGHQAAKYLYSEPNEECE